MSPTSYQAAPPRTVTISDEQARVKSPWSELRSLSSAKTCRSLLEIPSEHTIRKPLKTSREDKPTTRCTECYRTAKLSRNSNARRPCPCWSGRDSGPRYRIAAPSPWHESSGQLALSGDNQPVADRRAIGARLVCRG